MCRVLGPRWLLAALGCAAVAAASVAVAAPPFKYQPGKFEGGELKFVGETPVLVVRGTADEMGRQVATLGVKQVAPLVQQTMGLLQRRPNFARAWAATSLAARATLGQFPPEHLRELNAAARASGLDREWFIVGNAAGDLLKVGEMAGFGACSTFVVQPARSATGGLLFGRNLDLPPLDPLPEYTLVVVQHPAGKRSFASIGFPGMIGVASAMNDAGLCVTINEITSSADRAPKFDPAGVPMAILCRRLMEECATVAEAEQLLRTAPRTTMYCLTVCDRQRGVVFEITARNVGVRQAEQDICACTNHFRTAGLATSTQCWRYPRLAERRASDRPFGVEEVRRALDGVNQGVNTMQTMVFEPAALRLHLAYGRGPATRLPLRRIDLAAELRDAGR